MSINLNNFWQGLVTAAGGITNLTPAQITAAASGLTSLVGPSAAESQLLALLGTYEEYVRQSNTTGETIVRAQIAGISGLPAGVTDRLPAVWSATDFPSVQNAVSAVKQYIDG